MKFWALAVSFVGLLILADWLAARYVVSVGLGYQAPAGVWCIGGILAVRDWLQDIRGLRWSMALVAVASLISLAISVYTGWAGLRDIAIGSFVAFLVSESLDAAIYTPLRREHRIIGVAASVMAGAVLDSFIFLMIAFHSLAFFRGQVLGKWEMVPVAIVLVWLRRSGLPRLQVGADWARQLLVRPAD